MLELDSNKTLIDLINRYIVTSDGDLSNESIESIKLKINLDFIHSEILIKIYQGALQYIISWVNDTYSGFDSSNSVYSFNSNDEKIFTVMMEPILKHMNKNHTAELSIGGKEIPIERLLCKTKRMYTFFESYNPIHESFSQGELKIPKKINSEDIELFMAMVNVMKFYNVKAKITNNEI